MFEEEPALGLGPVEATPPDLRANGNLRAVIGDLRPGHQLDRYRLLAPIARGGMAVVWAACDAIDPSPRIVALKTMLPALSDDPRFCQMFAAETRIASRIRHAHVCEVLDVGRHGGIDYLVMEWVDGEPVSALLGKGRYLPWGVATRIAIDAAEGLHAAHELRDEMGRPLGIVHRDVSPQNILLTRTGVAKIADFGVAKATEIGAGLTQSGSIKGKVDYLSPEQAFSEPLDRRVDVFALGAVLYEMTTGRKPFGADTQMATLVKLTSADPVERAREMVPGYPPQLDAVLMRALEKDRTERHATMAELAADLREAIKGMDAGERSDVGAYVCSAGAASFARRSRIVERALANKRGPMPTAANDVSRAISPKSRPLGARSVVVAALVGGLCATAALPFAVNLRKTPQPAPNDGAPGTIDRNETRLPIAALPPQAPPATEIAAVSSASAVPERVTSTKAVRREDSLDPQRGSPKVVRSTPGPTATAPAPSVHKPAGADPFSRLLPK